MMDLAEEELQPQTIPSLLTESVDIPRRSPRTFYLITLTLVFLLSFAILTHSFFTRSIFSHLSTTTSRHNWTFILFSFAILTQSLYFLFLFSISILSTASIVFTVASLYSSKPLSFSSSLFALPSVLHRLFLTFLWAALLMLALWHLASVVSVLEPVYL